MDPDPYSEYGSGSTTLLLTYRYFAIPEELKPRRKSSTPRDELAAEAQFESFSSELKAVVQPVTQMEVSPDISLGKSVGAECIRIWIRISLHTDLDPDADTETVGKKWSESKIIMV